MHNNQLWEKLGARKNREVKRTPGPNSKEARTIGKRYRHLKRLFNNRCDHTYTAWTFAHTSGSFSKEHRSCTKCGRVQQSFHRIA